MDYEVLRETLKATLDEVAFVKDEDDNNISILGKAQSDLKEFLENNTSISDDEKAKHFSSFLTNVITGVTTQAIIAAGDAPLKDAQIDTMRAESTQKILSMQNEDKARMNDSAVNVVRAKAEVETLVPAQVSKLRAEITALEKDAIIKEKEIAIKEAEIPLKEAQVLTEQERVLSMQAETAVREAELPLKEAQLDIALKDAELKEKEIAIREAELPLKEAQAEIAKSDVKLREQQIEVARSDVKLKEAEIELRETEIDISKDQIKLEEQKVDLMKQEVVIKQAEMQYRSQLSTAQAFLAKEQAVAVSTSLNMQHDIEEARNQKDISVAEIYAGGK